MCIRDRPANLAAAVVAQAEAGADHFTRPWAGVSAQGVDAATANALGLDVPQGVLLSDLHPVSYTHLDVYKRQPMPIAYGAFAVGSGLIGLLTYRTLRKTDRRKPKPYGQS